MAHSGKAAWIEANDLSHRYVLDGPSGDAPLLVLVNEMGGTLEGWDRMVPALTAEGFQVLHYDMRHSGLNERSPAPFGFADLADDLARLCAALALPPAEAVLGSAFGGAVALCHAARHPARVRSVLAMAPAVGVPRERLYWQGPICWYAKVCAAARMRGSRRLGPRMPAPIRPSSATSGCAGWRAIPKPSRGS